MSLNVRRESIRIGGLPAIAAAATILVAATFDPDENWTRLRAIPNQERQRLMENLRKFDLLYSAGQQQGLRDLDRRINELDPARRAQYLGALRRYHNWLNQLPEMKQGEIKDKTPDERMSVVTKLVSDFPVTPNGGARFLGFVDVGAHSPLELAAIYQIWQVLSPTERQQIEKSAPGTRRQHILKRGEKKKIAGEIKPADLDEQEWISAFKTWVRTHRRALLDMFENDADQTEILRRQAINFHFLETKKQPKSVTPEHLAEFLASFPPWLQSSFDHHAPDEARRRLSVVYRLVFPPGAEIKVGPAAADRSKPVAPKSATKPAGKTPTEPGDSPF